MRPHVVPRARLLANLAALAALVPAACGPGPGNSPEPAAPDRPVPAAPVAEQPDRSPHDNAGSVLVFGSKDFTASILVAETPAVAARHGLRTYSDLAVKAPEPRLGGPAEVAAREDGLPGLRAQYGGFVFDAFVPLGTGLLRYDSLRDGLVDVVVALGTDGRITADGLVVLEDDRRYCPLYQVAPVVRLDALAAHPEIAPVLDELAPLLTDPVMSGLNYQVDVAGRAIAKVADESVRQIQLQGSR